jgi:hypothetical protein
MRQFFEDFRGSDYIKKIIQLPIHIPSWNNHEISKYVAILIRDYKNFEIRSIFRENIDLITEAVELNPHEVKRFLNLFLLKYKVDRLFDNISSPPQELIVTLSLQLRWNWFYEAILSDPFFLKELHKYLFERGGSIQGEVPELITQVLREKPLVDFLKGSGNIVFQMHVGQSTVDQMSKGVMDTNTNLGNKIENEENLKLIDNFPKLDKEKQEVAWNKIMSNRDLAERFAFSLGGTNFREMDNELQDRVWSEVGKNNEFAKGIGSAIGVNYPRINGDILEKAWNIANTNKYFAYSFGHSLAQSYDRLDTTTQDRVVQLSRTNSKFAEGVISALGKQITSNPKLQDYVFSLIGTSDSIARSFAFSLDSKNFREMDDELQQRIWEIAGKNRVFAAALGEAMAEKFSLLDNNTQQRIWYEINRNKAFSDEFANTLVKNYELLDADSRNRFWIEVVNSEGSFGSSALFDFGRYFDKMNKDVRDEIIDAIGKRPRLREDFEMGRKISKGVS